MQLCAHLYRNVMTPDSMARCDSSSALSDVVDAMITYQQGAAGSMCCSNS
jgi:hypothetical protein